MSLDKKGFTLIEILSVLVVLGIVAALAVPRYHDLQEEARRKAAAAAVSEAQARVNLAFARYVLAGHSCAELKSVQLREPFEGEDAQGVLFIGDGLDTWGKAGGWTFLADIKNLEEFHETTPVKALLDPDGRKIDVSGAGLFLFFPQCGDAAEKKGP